MRDEITDVVDALAERRQADRYDIQAIVEVLAKQALPDHLTEIAVRRRHDPDIGLDGRTAANHGVFAFLQHAQQAGLGVHRHIADFIEEKRAAFGLLEAAGRARHGTGESPLLVPEQLRLDQIARDRRHVDGDKRPVAPLAEIVERPGDQFLAGTTLAGDHHRQVGLHQSRQGAVDILHGGRPADQRHGLARLVGLAVGRGRLLGIGQRPRHHRQHLSDIEGLGQILIGAHFIGADRRHEGVLGAHHDHRQVGPELFDLGHDVEGVAVRHHDVGDQQFALAPAHPVPHRRHIAGGAHFVAGTGQCLVQHHADRRVVVRKQNSVATHALNSCSVGRLNGPLATGRRMRNRVRPGRLSLSITPP